MIDEDFSFIDLARFEVRLRALEPTSLPPFLGSTLRGSFGHALKDAVCVVDHRDCLRCALLDRCVYPYLFETPVPPGIQQLRGQDQAPVPFIIEPPIVENPVRRVWRIGSPQSGAGEPTTSSTEAPRSSSRRTSAGLCATNIVGTAADRSEPSELAGAGSSSPESATTPDARSGTSRLGAFAKPALIPDQSSSPRLAGSGSESETRRTHSIEGPRIVTSVAFPDQPRRFNLGEELSFGLTLVGRAIDCLPYVVYSISEMCRTGLGANRGRFDLKEVTAKGLNGDRHPVYSDESTIIYDAPGLDLRELIGIRMRGLEGAAGPSDRAKLKFLTPARIRVKDDLQTGLSFELLVRNLLRRVSMLAAVHGEGRMDLDYRGLTERAGRVRVEHSSLRWWDLERFSNRQSGKMKLGGLIGEVEYEGDAIEKFLPLLFAGELLHVGTGTSFGLGKYQILETSE